MDSIWNTHFLVIDVETTGFSPILHSLIDVACVSTVGGNVAGRFSSLINPHLPIPDIIMHLTHISNEMVATAPEEYDVLLQLRDILLFPGAVFVAHNAAFDYPFVKGAFEKEGIEFPKIDKLCTLKLARRLLKKDLKKNVGSLSEYFGYEVKDRHRALGDADATAYILKKLMQIAEEEHGVTTREELLELQNSQIKNYPVAPVTFVRLAPYTENLPDCPGIFRLRNRNETVHYIGSAGNLHDYIRTNLLQNKLTSRKLSAMMHKTFSLECRETNSELEANLLAASEIRRISPYYNLKKDKSGRKFSYIKLNSGYKFPNLEMTDEITSVGDGEYFGPFTSSEVCEKIFNAAEKYFPVRKCQNALLNENPNGLPCIYYTFKQCPAPCCGFISSNDYMRGIDDLRKYISGSPDALVSNLEKKMYAYAEKLEFEKAQAVKELISIVKSIPQNTPESRSAAEDAENNLMLVIPVDPQGKIVQILFIRKGFYIKEFTIGIKANLAEIEEEITRNYFSEIPQKPEKISASDEEMRIVKSYMQQNKGLFRVIYIQGKTKEAAAAELENAVRNFYYAESTAELVD